jgi:ribonuclease VapC
MVIDTSAIVAILLNEPERESFTSSILAAPSRLMSAISKLEAGMVLIGREGVQIAADLDELIGQFDIEIVPFDNAHASIARDAFVRYGKGRHPAGLNFGDCAAYALAIAEAEPLLFKGTDFGATDVQVVAV